MKIFLSYSFRPEDQELASKIRETLEDFDFKTETGKHLGGAELEDEIKKRIEDVGALVTLFTKRSHAECNESTHDWVKWELQQARDKDKFAIVLIEDGVPLGGPEKSKEYIQFAREKFDATLLALMKKTMVWKRKVGRRLKVQLLPPELAITFKHEDTFRECWVRYSRDGKAADWRKVDSVAYEENGAFAYIDVPDDQSLQIKVVEPSRGTNTVWTSPWVPGNRVLITLET